MNACRATLDVLSLPNETCSWVDLRLPCQCQPNAGRFDSFHAKDGLPDAHATTPLDFFSSCLFYSFCLKQSATHVVDKDFFCQTFFVR